MGLVPIHVKVVLDEEGNERLMINGYRLHNLVDAYTQEDLDKDLDKDIDNCQVKMNEELIDNFYADKLIILSSLDYGIKSMDERINGLGSLGFEVRNPTYDHRYFNFILHNIPWFPSFSVDALTSEELLFAARCVPRILYQTQALKPFKNFYDWPPTSETPTEFETTRDWICAEPYDAYITFHLVDFINGMQNIMGKTYNDFLEQNT